MYFHLSRFSRTEFSAAYVKYFSRKASGPGFERLWRISRGDPWIVAAVERAGLDPDDLNVNQEGEIVRQFFDQKLSGYGRDAEVLVQGLARRMMEVGREYIRPDEEPVASQREMVDKLGILGIVKMGSSGNGGNGIVGVRFGHARLAEQIFLMLLDEFEGGVEGELPHLLGRARALPSLAGALRRWYIREGSNEDIVRLAGAEDGAARQLASSILIGLGEIEPQRVYDVVDLLLHQDSAWAREVAVASTLPHVHDPLLYRRVLEWGFSKPAEAADLFYLVWKRGGGHIKLVDLIPLPSRTGLSKLLVTGKFRGWIELLTSLTWHMIVNNLNVPGVVAEVSDYWNALLPTKRASVTVVERITREMATDRVQLVPRYFVNRDRLDLRTRQAIERITPYLDPSYDSISNVSKDLQDLFDAPRALGPFPTVVAGVCFAVRAYSGTRNDVAYLKRLYDEGRSLGSQMSMLASLAIYAPVSQASELNLELISHMTEDLALRKPQWFIQPTDPYGLSQHYDINILWSPLAFATCRIEGDCTFSLARLVDLLQGQGKVRRQELESGLIKGLVPVALHCPGLVWNTLYDVKVVKRRNLPQLRALFAILDLVDPEFSERAEEYDLADEYWPDQLSVDAVGQLLRYAKWLGNLNALFHMCHYPLWRQLGQYGMTLIVSSDSDRDIASAFASMVVERAFEHKLRLDRMMASGILMPPA